MTIGEQIPVTIDDLAFGGDGVGRAPDGTVVFVPLTAVGDAALVSVTQVRKNFARGEVVAISHPGPGRCDPQCRLYGKCAGCQYQHLEYEIEFAAKKKQLRDLLRRIGGIDPLPEFAAAVAAPQPYGYRNKLRLEPAFMELPGVDGLRLAYGYYGNDNRTLQRVTNCPLAADAINDGICDAIHSQWGKANARKRGKDDRPGALTLRLTSEGALSWYFGYAPRRVPWLRETLNGIEYSVPLGSFWQVNPAVAGQLLEAIAGWVEPLTAETFIDAYAGVGTFTCAMRNPFRERLLIENDREAAKAAQFNVAGRRQLGCQIIPQTTEKALPKLLGKCNAAATAVLLDPPRSGCQDAVIEALTARHPATVIYVSCNPSTLARDLKRLCANGSYHVEKLAIFDMFPRTAHFETAVMLHE